MPRLSVDISHGQQRALKWAALQSGPGSTVATVVRGWLDRLPVPPQGAPIEESESRPPVPVCSDGTTTHDFKGRTKCPRCGRPGYQLPEPDVYDVLSAAERQDEFEVGDFDPGAGPIDPPGLYGAEGHDGRDFLGPSEIIQEPGSAKPCLHPSKRVLSYGTFCDTCGTKL